MAATAEQKAMAWLLAILVVFVLVFAAVGLSKYYQCAPSTAPAAGSATGSISCTQSDFNIIGSMLTYMGILLGVIAITMVLLFVFMYKKG